MMSNGFTTVTDELVLPSIQQLHLSDGHSGLCFICDGATNNKSIQLQFGQTVHSKISLPIKLGQLIGDDFMVIVSVNDRLCFTCIELINLADKLEIKLNDVKKVITEHLKTKYQLSDDFIGSCDDIGINGSYNNDSCNDVSEMDDIVDSKRKDQPLSDVRKTDDSHEKTKDMIIELDSDVEIVEETTNNVKEDLLTKNTNSSHSINLMGLSTLQSSDSSSPFQSVNQIVKQKEILDKSSIESVDCNSDKIDNEVNTCKINKPVTRIQVKKNIVCNKINNKCKLKLSKSLVNQPAFKCKMCDEEFQTQVLLRRHIMKSHLSKWSCYFCSITFSNDNEYQNHMKTHIRNVKIQPQPTVKISDEINDIDSAESSSRMEKQNDVRTFFKCKNCKFKTKFNFLLDKHESECFLGDTTAKINTFECNLCSTIFKSSKKLKSHVCDNNESISNVKDCDSIVDNAKKISNFQCGICSLKFNDKNNLVQHLRNHKISNMPEKNVLNNSTKLDSQTEVIQVDVDLSTNENDFDLTNVQMVDEADDQISSVTLINCDGCSLSFDKQSSFVEHICEHKNNKISDCRKSVNDNDADAAEIYFDNVKHFMAVSSETPSMNLSSNKGKSLNFNITNEETNSDKKTDTNIILTSNFICDTCNTSFSDKNDLDKHTMMYDHKFKQNFGDFKYNLITSDNSFDNKNFENENEVEENKSNSVIESQFVSKIIINSLDSNHEDNVGDGVENVKKFDKFPCQLCTYIALSLYELKNHEIIDHNIINDMIICNICDKVIIKSDESEHYNSHKTIYCKYCSFETKSQNLMIRHIKEHNKNNIRKEKLGYLCQYCSETFKTKKLLKSHEELHPENFEFHCVECDKKFMKEKQLKNHFDEVHRDPHCCYCGKEIFNLKALKNHEQRHIRELQNMNKLECDICKKVFKTKTGLRHHFAVHTGKFTYFCDFCQRGFMSRMMLEEHRSRHTKEDRYVCDVCGRKFTFQSTYWIHRKWHDTPFPYKCNYCGRLFKHTSLLAVHKRKHTGERPYKCPHCPLSFTVGGTLKRHLILHTQKFPFWCEPCKRGFTTKHKYSVHLSKVHNNDELLSDKKASKNQTDYKMVVKDKLTISNGESENEKLSSTSRDQTDNFEFMPDSTNFTLVNMEEDDTGNSAVMMPCIMTTVNNEENSGLVFEIISGSPLQQISNSITLPENTILPDMWCQ